MMVQDTIEVTVVYTVNKCIRCPMMKFDAPYDDDDGMQWKDVCKCRKDKSLVLEKPFEGIHENCPYRRKEE